MLEITCQLGNPNAKGQVFVLLLQDWREWLTRVSECHVGCHMYFVGLGQYISSLSSEPACKRKRWSNAQGDCPLSRESV